MSPQSNSSSMGAQNGSVYDYSSSYPNSTGDSRYPPQRQLSDPSAATYNRQHRNAPNSESSYTRQRDTSTEYYTSAQTNSGPHYFPTYDQETPQYDHELAVDDDHQNNDPDTETLTYGGLTQQVPAQNQTHQSHQDNRPNGTQSPTTERWRNEQSPEERFRLGLSRCPTAEEQRLAYEEAEDEESRRGQ
ncbi:hypothetical protein IFR04_008137 [Cadophora malorum]|uniref:Uncharacterized protein n=1 Tax=Cadophora malorum TaxID=108018 RepID=A0A8H7W7Z1_9HELO|nr:hypothetical protein IFR04_008137 [Cadophora malorum]